MSKTEPESPKEFREYCHNLWKTDKNYGEYLANFRRLVCLVVFFLSVICGLNVWLFYKG
jgi:hypothetical protein